MKKLTFEVVQWLILNPPPLKGKWLLCAKDGKLEWIEMTEP